MPVQVNNQFREIVKDYVGYKLRQNNIFLDGFNENCPSQASKHLRIIADELIADNRELFQTMCDQLHLTPISTYPTFVGIADEIFQTGKNWGRVVAFLAFGATLSVYCAQREELYELIEDIVEWVSRYMDQNLAHWISENGGWDGFINFFQRDEGPSDNNNESGTSNWGVAAVAGLGLGALLMLACR